MATGMDWRAPATVTDHAGAWRRNATAAAATTASRTDTSDGDR